MGDPVVNEVTGCYAHEIAVVVAVAQRVGRVTAFLALSVGLVRCGGDSGPLSPAGTPTPVPVAIPATGAAGCDPGRFWYHWACYSTDQLQVWGLGREQTTYVHNDRPYEWYIDQGQTGPASDNNCGPSSVVMAAKWYHRGFKGTVEEARDMFPRDGGWWYVSDILAFLDARAVPHVVVAFKGVGQVRSLLTNGNILVLCVNTLYLRRNKAANERVDRFYDYGSGHFLVVKGLRTTDLDVFVETYDPATFLRNYDDLTPKGRDRAYRAADISGAVSTWWPYLVVVAPERPTAAPLWDLPERVDAGTIPDAWGR